MSPHPLLIALLVAAPALTAATTIRPLPAVDDFVSAGTLYGAKTGLHRSTITARHEGRPATLERALTVTPGSALWDDATPGPAGQPGTRPLPVVYAGYTVAMDTMPAPTRFTLRPQFQSGHQGMDFLNFNLYLEDNQLQPAGLALRFAGAFLFPLQPAGRIPLRQLRSVTYISYSQDDAGRALHAVVRDATSGRFYASEIHATGQHHTIDLGATLWLRLNPADLLDLSAPAATAEFTHIDHVGLLITAPLVSPRNPVPAYGVIYNATLHSFEYTLADR